MKLKSKKAAAKRFKLTATGKVKFRRAGMRHLFAGKSNSYNLSKRQGGYLFSGDEGHIAKMLPYGTK